MTQKGVPQYESAIDRIFRRAIPEPNTGCWLWTGSLTDGYGITEFRRRAIGAHRLAYETFVGPIPEGLVIDHKCRVRCCVNPEHLEPVTFVENIRRGVKVRPKMAHCKRGHPRTEENTSVHFDRKGNPHRRCKVCRRRPT